MEVILLRWLDGVLPFSMQIAFTSFHCIFCKSLFFSTPTILFGMQLHAFAHILFPVPAKFHSPNPVPVSHSTPAHMASIRPSKEWLFLLLGVPAQPALSSTTEIIGVGCLKCVPVFICTFQYCFNLLNRIFRIVLSQELSQDFTELTNQTQPLPLGFCQNSIFA